MANHGNLERPRGGDGKWIRDIATVERDAKCARLRATGMKYRDIAAELGIDVRSAFDGVQHAMREAIVEDGTAARNAELERLAADNARLDDLEQVVIQILEADHIMVNNGQIIRLDNTPLADGAPVLAAVDRLLKIGDSRRRNGERIAKLLGLDAAAKLDLSGGVRYEIVGVDPAALT